MIAEEIKKREKRNNWDSYDNYNQLHNRTTKTNQTICTNYFNKVTKKLYVGGKELRKNISNKSIKVIYSFFEIWFLENFKVNRALMTLKKISSMKKCLFIAIAMKALKMLLPIICPS